MRALAFVFLLLAAPAVADGPLPALYDVVGVGGGDRLNVREGPDAQTAVVGSLAPDAKGVEVVAVDAAGAWGRVNTRERAGWVAMRYLAPQPETRAMPGELPPGFSCFGTEPFWTLRPDGGRAVFSTPDRGDEALALSSSLVTGIVGDQRRALIAEGDGRRITATIEPGLCSDNMSDRLYGLTAMVVLEGEDVPELLTGCCSLAR